MDAEEQLLLTAQRFKVYRHRQPIPEGGFREREIVRHPGAVVILPIVDADHVCLIRNYRVAAGKELIELPAGTLEPPEPADVTARRELEEETGYRAGRWRFVQAFYLSPGILDERMHFYIADQLTPGPTHREPGEQIENLVVPWSTALEWVHAGQIEDSKTIVGLLMGHALR